MAWTVAFALLGAMTFSIFIVPVLASMFFRGDSRSGATASWSSSPTGYRKGLRWAVGHRWVIAGGGVDFGGGNDLSGIWRRHRRGVPASPG
jgi:cobalt-zinc-cadmium resistance protein CzcA